MMIKNVDSLKRKLYSLLDLYPWLKDKLSDSELYHCLCSVDENEISSYESIANIKVMWKCDNCSCTYSASVSDILKKNRVLCPVCVIYGVTPKVREIPLKGRHFNELYGSEYEDILYEWDTEKNTQYNDKFYSLTVGSNYKVWWKCSKCGNEWQSTIANRFYKKNGCPKCGRKQIKITDKKEKSLAYLYPNIAKEWNTHRNEGLGAENVTAYSNKKVWWKCNKCGNEWIAKISNRTRNKTGCPCCKTNEKNTIKDDMVSPLPIQTDTNKVT